MNDNIQPELAQAARGPNTWEHFGWIWHAVFGLTLLVPLLVTLLSETIDAADRLTAVGAYALMGLLYVGAYGLSQRLGSIRRRVVAGLAYLLTVFILWYVLIQISPINYVILFSLYAQVYSLLTIRWAVGTSILLTGLVAFEQVGGDLQALGSGTFLLTFLVMNVAGIALGLWIYTIIRQSGQRRALIERLEATQAELAAAERREGMLAERQRLAREIHDTLAQGFTSIVMHLEAAEEGLAPGQETARRHLDQARRTARDSLAEARRVVSDLRPEILETEALPAAIRRTVDGWSAASDVTAHTIVSGDVLPLHPQIEVTLLRAVQEALANVRKHAGAREVTVTLSYFDDVVMLDVQDDGQGFDGRTPATGTSSGGYGLRGMAERAAALDGTLEIESEPGTGTTLVVSVPL